MGRTYRIADAAGLSDTEEVTQHLAGRVARERCGDISVDARDEAGHLLWSFTGSWDENHSYVFVNNRATMNDLPADDYHRYYSFDTTPAPFEGDFGFVDIPSGVVGPRGTVIEALREWLMETSTSDHWAPSGRHG